jgi:hypothetical protein
MLVVHIEETEKIYQVSKGYKTKDSTKEIFFTDRKSISLPQCGESGSWCTSYLQTLIQVLPLATENKKWEQHYTFYSHPHCIVQSIYGRC